MLSNEKYMGILLLQKTYTPDFLTGKQKKNRGELSMYMIEDAHDAGLSMGRHRHSIETVLVHSL